MKRIKDFLKTLLFILAILILIYGIGFVSYKVWRAEHPQAKTWTFFIHSK